jgi:hypothetical protein
MKCTKVIAIGTLVAVSVLLFTRRAAHNIVVDGVAGIADMTQHLCEERCSPFTHHQFFLWQRFDPTCPECL